MRPSLRILWCSRTHHTFLLTTHSFSPPQVALNVYGEFWGGIGDDLAGEFIYLFAHIYLTGCDLLP